MRMTTNAELPVMLFSLVGMVFSFLSLFSSTLFSLHALFPSLSGHSNRIKSESVITVSPVKA